MLSKRYESTVVDRRSCLHVPSGTHWSTSSDTHQEVELEHKTRFLLSCIKIFLQVISIVKYPHPRSKCGNSARACEDRSTQRLMTEIFHGTSKMKADLDDLMTKDEMKHLNRVTQKSLSVIEK